MELCHPCRKFFLLLLLLQKVLLDHFCEERALCIQGTEKSSFQQVHTVQGRRRAKDEEDIAKNGGTLSKLTLGLGLMLPACYGRSERETGISLFQFSSVAQSCLTLCDPMDCSTPGLPVHHQLQEFIQTHVHRVGDTIPTLSSSVVPFSSHPQSFPASGSFQMSQFFPSGGQSIGVSASTSVLPMNIQD